MAATPFSSTCAKSSKVLSSGLPASRARSWSAFGGRLRLDSGQDLSVGYDSHDADVVRLYLEESFSFRVATPEACGTRALILGRVGASPPDSWLEQSRSDLTKW